MSQISSDLDPKKEAAIVALLSSRNVEEAAQAAGIDPRTLYRWMKEPDFDTAYRAAKRAAYSQAIARLHQMAGAAATTLGKIMLDQGTPASVRLRAADSILAHVAKGIELEDIDARVAELERVANLNSPQGNKRL